MLRDERAMIETMRLAGSNRTRGDVRAHGGLPSQLLETDGCRSGLPAGFRRSHPGALAARLGFDGHVTVRNNRRVRELSSMMRSCCWTATT